MTQQQQTPAPTDRPAAGACTVQPVVGLAAFEDALVRHGVVQAAAVADSMDYDEGRTAEAILKAYEDTMQRVEHDRFNLWCIINEVATWLTSINEFERAAQLFCAIKQFKSNKSVTVAASAAGDA